MSAKELKLIIRSDAEYFAALKDGRLERATHFEMRDCNSVTSVDAPNATHFEMRGCNSVTSVDAPNATHFEMRYCNSVTSVDAPNATHFEMWRCNSVTSVDAPNATHFEMRGCNSVTSVDAPNATHFEMWGCNSVTRVAARNATYFTMWDCNSVTSVDAPNATHFDIRYCNSVTSVTVDGETFSVVYIDGYSNVIGPWRHSRGYEVTKGFIIGAGLHSPIRTPIKIAKLGEHYAHGKTYKEAKQGAAFKNKPDVYDKDELRASIKQSGVITALDFHLVTTACLAGIRIHLESQGLDPHAQSLPIEQAIAASRGTSYGESMVRFLEAAQ